MYLLYKKDQIMFETNELNEDGALWQILCLPSVSYDELNLPVLILFYN